MYPRFFSSSSCNKRIFYFFPSGLPTTLKVNNLYVIRRETDDKMRQHGVMNAMIKNQGRIYTVEKQTNMPILTLAVYGNRKQNKATHTAGELTTRAKVNKPQVMLITCERGHAQGAITLQG